MQYFKSLSILFISLFIVACGNGVEKDEVEDPFISVTTIIDSTYPKLDPTAVDIMDKLQICTIIDTVLTMPPCVAEIYRVFQYRSGKEFKDGFIVENSFKCASSCISVFKYPLFTCFYFLTLHSSA